MRASSCCRQPGRDSFDLAREQPFLIRREEWDRPCRRGEVDDIVNGCATAARTGRDDRLALMKRQSRRKLGKLRPKPVAEGVIGFFHYNR